MLPAYAELHCLSNFTLPARRFAPGGTGGARPRGRLRRPGDHGRVHAERRGARPSGGPGNPAPAHDRHRDRPRRRPATGAAGHQPQRLRQSLRTDHARAPRRGQGRVPPDDGRPGEGASRLPRRPDSTGAAGHDAPLSPRGRGAGGEGRGRAPGLASPCPLAEGTLPGPRLAGSGTAPRRRRPGAAGATARSRQRRAACPPWRRAVRTCTCAAGAGCRTC